MGSESLVSLLEAHLLIENISNVTGIPDRVEWEINRLGGVDWIQFQFAGNFVG